MSQVQEATTSLKRDPREWDLAPQIHRGLFDVRGITHILVGIPSVPARFS
jgi:hypothetical protein